MTDLYKDWNPDLYLKYGRERIQPSIDLVSRISYAEPRDIIDIGCGPGNSTQILAKRWPNAQITGIDNSPAMIEKARRDFPNQEWRLLDAGKDAITGRFDIVFSNATIQWIPDHDNLIRKFYELLSEKGVLAIQIPLFWEMPVGKAIKQISKNYRWHSLMTGITTLFTIHDYSFYYNILSSFFSSVEIWQSSYMHILDSQSSILEMVRSTGLRPFLERIESKESKSDFEQDVLAEIKKEYPLQKDGKVIFPFIRLFFVAYK